MKKELEQKLVTAFPNLYKQYGGDMTRTCMSWGFEHGDGWYDIIYNLSEQLEPTGVVAAQVKEKYGTLRFYLDYPEGASDELWDQAEALVDKAELLSAYTCEICGKPGKVYDGGWVVTRCEECKK